MIFAKLKREKRAFNQQQKQLLPQITDPQTAFVVKQQINQTEAEIIMLEILHAEQIYQKASEILKHKTLKPHKLIPRNGVFVDLFTPYHHFRCAKHIQLESFYT